LDAKIIVNPSFESVGCWSFADELTAGPTFTAADQLENSWAATAAENESANATICIVDRAKDGILADLIFLIFFFVNILSSPYLSNKKH